MTDIVQGVISYLNSPDYERRAKKEDTKLLTQIELTTRGIDDPDYSEVWMGYLQDKMGAADFAKWLARQNPPLDERSDAEIRAALFAKLQEVMR